MSDRFKPAQYRDEFRTSFSWAVRQRLKRKNAKITRKLEAQAEARRRQGRRFHGPAAQEHRVTAPHAGDARAGARQDRRQKDQDQGEKVAGAVTPQAGLKGALDTQIIENSFRRFAALEHRGDDQI